MILILFFIILTLFGILYLLRALIKNQQRHVSFVEYTVVTAYLLALLLAGIGFVFHSSQYNQPVDPVDGDCYIPFGGKHILSLFIYFVAFNISAVTIWIKGRRIPPSTRSIPYFLPS